VHCNPFSAQKEDNAMNLKYAVLILLLLLVQWGEAVAVREVKLSGTWQLVKQGSPAREVQVPGIANNPAKMDTGPVRLRKEVELPAGDWSHATLLLKGARFNPKVYINGAPVSSVAGGMAPTTHPLVHAAVKPGSKVLLEVELMSLADMSEKNASYIPSADHWRSNVSSMLWDDVVLQLHGFARIDRMIPFTDLQADKPTSMSTRKNFPMGRK
jgi:beta-galactosidase